MDKPAFVYSIQPNPDYGYIVDGEHIFLRPMQPNLRDGYYVTRWRNHDSARVAFWNTQIVTPESHINWLNKKSPYDMVWMGCKHGTSKPIGMVGLIIDPATHSGEAGRYFVDQDERGNGFGVDLDKLVIATAFQLFNLNAIWLDAWAANETAMNMHIKNGWRVAGYDIAGHTRVDGSVVHMIITANDWHVLHAP